MTPADAIPSDLDLATIVDVTFPVMGQAAPADHGFALFGAVCCVVPSLHGDAAVGVHPLSGTPAPGRRLLMRPGSVLRIRLPADRILALLPLAGAVLDLAGMQLRLGVPRVHPLRPAPTLLSRLVTIKGFTEPRPFLEAARRQLVALDSDAEAELLLVQRAQAWEGGSARAVGQPLRRTLAIHDRQVVGFSLRVSGLSAAGSLRVQATGLGGRRRFGCGIFVPARL